jgi:hypothetical protein
VRIVESQATITTLVQAANPIFSAPWGVTPAVPLVVIP